ncbi:MAG: DUF2459 domain-containing protein [Proteobacteria bacterium]|nr:DUF2459 domain-containing protein [Pseudomonadota bacterium]
MGPRRDGPRARLSPLAGVALLGLVLAALATARPGDARLWPAPAGGAQSIYLVDNGFHTDLALPAQALAGHLAGRAAAAVSNRPWVMVGYGDRRFFIEQGMSPRRAADGLRSLFWPGNASALRLDGLASSPDRVYADGVRRIAVSPAGLAAIAAHIDASLARDGAGAPIRLAAPPQPDTGFFAATQPFSLVHLCNHWTAELLNAAGLPTTPVLDVLPQGLKLDLWLRARLR